jgi:hypothetical protein
MKKIYVDFLLKALVDFAMFPVASLQIPLAYEVAFLRLGR